MMILKGVFDGCDTRPYSFTNKAGVLVEGSRNNAFVRSDSPSIAPNERLQEVKVPKDMKLVSKEGSVVAWEVRLSKGILYLVSETIVK